MWWRLWRSGGACGDRLCTGGRCKSCRSAIVKVVVGDGNGDGGGEGGVGGGGDGGGGGDFVDGGGGG